MQDQFHSDFQMTTWKNPTLHTVKFKIFQGPKKIAHIAIGPNKTAQIPSVYDHAIRTVRDGVVVAGLAPQLEPKGKEVFPMHIALADAARRGDQERALVAQTGVAAGMHHLDMATNLQMQIDALKAKEAAPTAPSAAANEMAELRDRLERAEARAAELEGMLTAPTGKPAAAPSHVPHQDEAEVIRGV